MYVCYAFSMQMPSASDKVMIILVTEAKNVFPAKDRSQTTAVDLSSPSCPSVPFETVDAFSSLPKYALKALQPIRTPICESKINEGWQM